MVGVEVGTLWLVPLCHHKAKSELAEVLGGKIQPGNIRGSCINGGKNVCTTFEIVQIKRVYVVNQMYRHLVKDAKTTTQRR